MLYLQKYLTNFQKRFFGRTMRKVAIVVWKFQLHRCFGFPMATLQLFLPLENVEILNFSLYTVPAEMLYLQKYLTNFQKRFFCRDDEEGGHCGWKLQMHRCFGFAITMLQLFQHPENVKISIFPFTLSQENCYIFKTIQRIFKNFLLAEGWWRWLMWLTISSSQIFWFCNRNVTTFPTSTKCQISFFPLHGPSRNAISSKVFNEF